MRLSRRALLLGGAAAGIGAAAGLALQPTAHRAPRRALGVLDPVAFSTLAAAVDAICPAAHGAPDPWALQVPEAIDQVLAAADPRAAAEVVQLLHALENGLAGFVLDQRPWSFTRSSDAGRAAALAAWRDSRLGPRRAGYHALVALVSATYWSHPATWPHLGYPGPPRFG
ncbi:MAG: gluconate 2-dehydrogenase subunit 3 family protein [Myxococcota bacterium]